MHERRLLIKKQLLEKEARQILDQLDAVFFKIAEVNAEIEEQREKQVIEWNIQYNGISTIFVSGLV